MNIDKKTIKDFHKNYIEGFMFNDINHCIEVGANFGVATLLLSYTENIGALINGHLGLKNHSHDDFNKMLEFFDFQGDEDYYKNFRVKFKKDISSDEEELDIYTVFRCGFIHEYFPKLPCIVHNNQQIDYCLDSEAGMHWFDDNSTKRLRFHNNAYYRDFKNAINKVFKQVSVDNDQELISRMVESLSRITDRVLIVP